MTDTISDMLTRIRNASRALLPVVELPHTKMKESIANILKHYGFSTTLNADVVIGRLNKGSREETTVQLEMIGRLLQFFRQMDAAMATDDHAQMIETAFLTGDYALTVMTGKKKEGGDEASR